MEKSLYEWAKEYHRKGYQVIPLEEGGKRPICPWQRYQKERVDEKSLEGWFFSGRNNLGVVTGAIGNVVVVDFDFRHGSEALYRQLSPPSVSIAHTGGGGVHLYCRFSPDGPKTAAGILPGVDTRGEGGYVVAPPSKTTGPYRFDAGYIPEISDLPRIEDIKGLPEILIERQIERKDIPRKVPSAGSFSQTFSFPRGVQGSRNDTATKVAGVAVRCCSSINAARSILHLWNHTLCKPPLGSDELELVLRSIWTKHHGKR